LRGVLLLLGEDHTGMSHYLRDLQNCCQNELLETQRGGCCGKSHIAKVYSVIRLGLRGIVKDSRIRKESKSCV